MSVALAPTRVPPASLSTLPPASPDAGPALWARVLGTGSIQRDFGHSVATNAVGDILVAARLEPPDDGGDRENDDQEHDDAPADASHREDATVDLSRPDALKGSP